MRRRAPADYRQLGRKAKRNASAAADDKPNEQAVALIWLVRKYRDTLKRLESLAASA
jgi:hypothetical protein